MTVEVSLHGLFLDADGNALTGSVRFTPRSVGALSPARYPRVPVVATLDDSGEFTVGLRAGDDPDATPSGWTYEVVELIQGQVTLAPYDIFVSADTVGTLELAELAPVGSTAGAGSIYATQAGLDAEATARLAADGALDVRLDDLETGGGPYDPAGAASAVQTASQPRDSDLTAIAALNPSNDDVVQRKAGAWTNRPPAQLKTDLALVKGDVGLGNVDNTSDVNKPISTATQAALDLKAPLASPSLTGTPTVPTATGGTNTTQAASTAFVIAQVALAITGLLKLQGNLDCSGNPNYPAGVKGDLYYTSVAGKVGGASGKSVDVGDAIVCKTDNAGGTEASVGTSWFVLEHNLAGALLASNNLSDLTSAPTARTNLGLVIGTNVQAWDTDLDTWATKTAPTGVAVGTTDTQTVTNKRVTRRVVAITNSATPAINTDNMDVATLDALNVAVTNFSTNLTGTPTDGQMLTIRIKDNGTARALASGASIVSRGATFPTTTVLGKWLYIGLLYNATAVVWDCVSVAQEA